MVERDVPYGTSTHSLACRQLAMLAILVAIAFTLAAYGLGNSRAAMPAEQVPCGAQSQPVWVILREEAGAVDNYDASTMNLTACVLDRAADLATGTPAPVFEHGLGEPMALH